MNKYKLLVILLMYALFNSSAAFAEMYKWVDKEGNISYSDQPPFKGAKKLNTPELTSVPAPDLPEKKTEAAPDASKETDNETTRYTYLKVTSPENDATIRDNEGNFSISIAVKPALNTAQGHYFSVNMDGKIVQDKLYVPSARLTNIDRGSHSISVSVKNNKGKTQRKSQAITVHLHRQSIQRKNPRINR